MFIKGFFLSHDFIVISRIQTIHAIYSRESEYGYGSILEIPVIQSLFFIFIIESLLNNVHSSLNVNFGEMFECKVSNVPHEKLSAYINNNNNTLYTITLLVTSKN